MTRTVNANSVKIVPEGSQEGILLSVSQDGKLATNKIDNQGNVDNQESALTSDFISLTDTPATFEAEKYLKVNAEGNALEFSDISISTDFISLTDTPETLDAGSYLRVNSTGDTIEQVKTAPPDGGVGDNGVVQEFSNFDGKLPDLILIEGGAGNLQRATFYAIVANKIQYLIWSHNSYYVEFDNDSAGNNGTFKGAAASGEWNFLNGETTLQEVIDNGHAIYHGQKSGTSGTGSLSAIKSASNFYTELPDAIVHQHGGIEYILALASIDANGTLGIFYRNEDHGDGTTQDRRIAFDNNAEGDINSYLTIFFTAADNLRWYIENGRAIYYGGGVDTTIVSAIINYDGTLTSASHDWIDSVSRDTTNIGNYAITFKPGHFTTPPAITVTADSAEAPSFNHASIEYNNVTVNGCAIYARKPSNGSQVSVGFSIVAHHQDRINKVAPPATGGGASEFTSLTDTPSGFDAGSYLRVNSTGDAIEQIKTAPPDGGLGDNSAVQSLSNFDGKLPDKLIVKHSLSTDSSSDSHGGYIVCELRQVSLNKIIYVDTWSDSAHRVVFNNNSAGDGWTKKGYGSNAVHILSPIDGVAAPSIQQLIDNGYAIYHGQKSGASGVGSLSIIKSSSNFYTELPDTIVCQQGTDEVILTLQRLQTGIIQYRNEDHGTAVSDNRFIYFNNNSDGTFSSKNQSYWTESMSDNSLRWFIENGRALYYGSDPVSSRIGQLEDIAALIPLANQIDIPDAILGRDGAGNLRLLKFTQARADRFDYQSNTTGGNYLFAFNSTTGVWVGGTHAVNSTKEYDDIQGYIAAGRALYYGRTGSNLDQLVGDIDDLSDVDTSTVAPSGGQVLVYDDTDSKWKPGAQSNDFVDLTDTPTALDAGSYLRVNSTGDAIEQIKTAPPDGGIGGNSVIQNFSNFNGKMPDVIIASTQNGDPVMMNLYHIDSGTIMYQGWTRASNPYYASFNNDSTGSGATQNYQWSFFDGATTLQEIIDNGHAIYNGQKSGTSGAGSLSSIKSLVNSSPNGGFYTELPDAIHCDVTNQTPSYTGVFRLHWVKPNTAAGVSLGWEIIYRAEYFGGMGDYSIRFIADADGRNVTSGSDKAISTMANNNLRWFIENGRAIYNGGYNDSNIVSARIAADGTILSSNYDWIQSVDANGSGSYGISFKPGHFTSPPTINVSADVVDGVSYVLPNYNNLTKDAVNVVTTKNNNASTLPAEFCIMAQHQDRPIALAAPQYGIKAWGKFDGTGSGSLSFTGGNIQSIVRVSAGLYKVTFINPAPHEDYSVSGSANPQNFSGAYFGVREDSNPVTATDFHIEIRDNTPTRRDSNRISFQVSY